MARVGWTLFGPPESASMTTESPSFTSAWPILPSRRAVGAKRIFELGSGYGYSAYWFSRAVGRNGELHLTDGDPGNEKRALAYLGRAGLDGPVTFHVGDALQSFANVEGEFDIVYCDIDKWEYPAAWEAARERIRQGGLYICDNVLWSGRVAQEEPEDDVRERW